MSDPVVDIHCHTFNGDDLPVRGFISHVGLHDSDLGSVLARLLDLAVQGRAPGYEAEKARLDALLGGPQVRGIYGPESEARAVEPDPREQLTVDTERALQELQVGSAPLLEDVRTAMQTAYPSEAGAPGLEARAFDFGLVRRAIQWVLLYSRYRLELTQLLIANFGGRVDLFCPLSVDLGAALGDVAKTTGRQQMELQEKISRLSMRADLPKAGKARVHPFVAFDPVHEVKARTVGEIETPLKLAQTAVETYGFVGVKLYPPMGWRPIGNASVDRLPKPVGERLDEALRDFYRWCEERHVPVTTHCNRSNFASEQVADLAAPQGWIDVLEEFPKLHLNLGHFGGVRAASSTSPGHDWPMQIARAAGDFDHLYVDVSNHPISEEGLMADYRRQLDQMFAAAETAAVRGRIMFGSDWFMEALHPQADQFLTQYEAFFGHWGAKDVEGFLGGRALEFLGFDDSHNQNAQRLRRRYEQYAPDNMPTWLAS